MLFKGIGEMYEVEHSEEERILIRDDQVSLERALSRFMSRPDCSERNKELVVRFLRDAALGKTVTGRAKRQIGTSRRITYLAHLTLLVEFFGKDLDRVLVSDVERFVEVLNNGKIASRRPSSIGRMRIALGGPLSPRYAADIKITLRTFYKWLLGSSRKVPELVDWIDTSFESKEVQALTETEVKRIIAEVYAKVQAVLAA